MRNAVPLLLRLCKPPVGRHESRQHWRDQLGRLVLLPGLSGERVSIGNEIAMDIGGQFQGQFDRLVIGNGA